MNPLFIISAVVLIFCFVYYVLALFFKKTLPLPFFLSPNFSRRRQSERAACDESDWESDRSQSDRRHHGSQNGAQGTEEMRQQIEIIKSNQTEDRKKIGELQAQLKRVRKSSKKHLQNLFMLNEALDTQNRRLDEIQRGLKEINQKINSHSPGLSQSGAEQDPDYIQGGNKKVANESEHPVPRLSEKTSRFGQSEPDTSSQITADAIAAFTNGKRLKEALLGCQGVNKEVLEREFDRYYGSPDDLEKMMRRLLDMWLIRAGLPKSVYENISERISDKSEGKGRFALPEIRSRHDKSKHDVLNYIALPSGASGEIIKVLKPGIIIDGEQITRAQVEVSQ